MFEFVLDKPIELLLTISFFGGGIMSALQADKYRVAVEEGNKRIEYANRNKLVIDQSLPIQAEVDSHNQMFLLFLFLSMIFIILGIRKFVVSFMYPISKVVSEIPVVGNVVGDVVGMADKTVGSVLGMHKSVGRKSAKMRKTRKSRK